jgi:hypothetical protein
MGIDIHVWRVLLIQVFQQLNQNKVLEYVGVIAGVEAMAVTQHREYLEEND